MHTHIINTCTHDLLNILVDISRGEKVSFQGIFECFNGWGGTNCRGQTIPDFGPSLGEGFIAICSSAHSRHNKVTVCMRPQTRSTGCIG